MYLCIYAFISLLLLCIHYIESFEDEFFVQVFSFSLKDRIATCFESFFFISATKEFLISRIYIKTLKYVIFVYLLILVYIYI